MFDVLAWAKEGFKRSWASVGFFEDMGITYIGVLNGHDQAELEESFERAFAMRTPVLVHVKTVKGRGYAPAELDSVSFHGASLPPVDLTLIDPTEEPLPTESAPRRKPKTYTHTFVEELVRLAQADARICAITAGMPTGTGLSRFADRFPERFFDVGIAEQHSVTMATGLALAGLRPVVALYSTFSQRAYDQLVHDVCQNDVPVLLAIDQAGLVGRTAPATRDVHLSAQRALPNLVIGSPKDEQELRDMVATAMQHDGPISLHYPRDAGEDLPDRDGQVLEIGRAEVLRSGEDLLLAGFGPIVQRLLAVAGLLERDHGLSSTVINARWAKPLDEACLAQHAAGKRLVVTAEVGGNGRLRDGVLDALNRVGVEAPLLKVALVEGFVHHGAVDDRRQQRIDAGESTLRFARRWACRRRRPSRRRTTLERPEPMRNAARLAELGPPRGDGPLPADPRL